MHWPTPEASLSADVLLIAAGRTAPNRAVVFGGEHDPLDDRGRRDIAALAPELRPPAAGPADQPPGRLAVRAGPEASVQQSARVLGVHFAVDSGLATLDVGDWRGRTPEAIGAAELGAWFADPAAVPHGGESIADFVARIRAHVDGVAAGSVLVVAKPVVQALLYADPTVFFATDVRPATVHAYSALR